MNVGDAASTGVRLFDSTDPDEVENFLSAFGDDVVWAGGERRARGRIVHLGGTPPSADGLGACSLVQAAFDLNAELRSGQPPDRYMVQMPVPGRPVPRLEIDGRVVSSPYIIFGPGPGRCVASMNDCTVITVSVSGDEMRNAVGARLGDVPDRGPRFEPEVLADTAHMGAWLDLVQSYVDISMAGFAARSPLADAHFWQVLLHGLLDLQPHSLSDALSMPGVEARSAAVRRAVAHCEEHPAEPISIADLANVARTSVRALQRAFRRELDITPLGYLRQVRLGRAHAELVEIGKGNAAGTVAGVAERWGFFHLPRFSESYRERYGQTPGRTARPGPE